MSSTDMVIVDRLRQVYWPQWLARMTLESVMSYRPIDFEHDTVRGHVRSYDRRRVRWFVDVLRSVRAMEPIEIDQRWFGTSPGFPVVLDGHHRYCAAVLLNKRRIAASCSGVVETIEWLTGKRRRDQATVGIDR